MIGKICMVTGATSGIGRVAALELARQGGTAVLVGRNPAKGEATVREIRERTGNSSVDFLLADLSSQHQVRQLAEEYQRRYQRLDVLVNNAGAIMLSRRQSDDGIEMSFALNHLNYFLLTNLLLDVLKSSSPARIINVASASHQGAVVDFEDLQGRLRYRGFRAYGQSKLANLLFTYELARRLEDTGVTANALHPGLVATNFLANNGLKGHLFNFFLRRLGMSAEKGAQTILYLATSPDVQGFTGRYFVSRQMVPSSEASYDRDAAQRLWQVSEELTGLQAEDTPN